MDHLECALVKLADQLQRIAQVWEEDLRWRKAHADSWISRADQELMQRGLQKALRMARRLGVVAKRLAALDAQTDRTATSNER